MFGSRKVFTLAELDALLDNKDLVNDDQVQQLNVVSSDQGPGYLSKWRMLGDAKDVWQKLQPIATTKSRRKVILCYTSRPTEWDVFLIAALVEHCKVFPWPKKPTPMSELESIPSTSYYWENKHEVKLASKAKVQTALAEQGINLNEYYILDQFAYQRIMQNLEMDLANQDPVLTEDDANKHGQYLNLIEAKNHFTPELLSELVNDGIDYDELKTVSVERIQDIELVSHWTLKSIYVESMTTSDVEDYSNRGIEKLLIKQLEVSKINKEWTLPSLDGLREIFIVNTDACIIDFSHCKDLESIRIVHADKVKKIILPAKKSLTVLNISNCDNLKNIELNGITEFGELVFNKIRQSNGLFDFTSVRKIGSLELNYSSIMYVDLTNIEIKKLHMVGLPDGFKIYFPSNSKLEEINMLLSSDNEDLDNLLTSSIIEDTVFLSDLRNKHRLNLSMENINEQTFARVKYFKCSIDKIVSLNCNFSLYLPYMKELKSLNFNVYTEVLDLSENKKLEYLTLRTNSLRKLYFPKGVVFERLQLAGYFPQGDQISIVVAAKKFECNDQIWLMVENGQIQLDPISIFSLTINTPIISKMPDENSIKPYKDLNSLDLRRFSNLKDINVNCRINSIVFPGSSNLSDIVLHCPIKALDLTDIHRLKLLKVIAIHLSEIKFSPQATPVTIDLNVPEACQFLSLNTQKLTCLDMRCFTPEILKVFQSPSVRHLVGSSFPERVNLGIYFPNISSLQTYAEEGIDVSGCQNLKSYFHSFEMIELDSATFHVRDTGTAELLKLANAVDLSEFVFSPEQSKVQVLCLKYMDLLSDVNLEVLPSLNSLTITECDDLALENENDLLKEPGQRFDRVNEDGDLGNAVENEQTNVRQRSISKYSKVTRLGIDGDTGIDETAYQANGELQTQVTSGQSIVNIHQFRVNYFNCFNFRNGKLRLCTVNINALAEQSLRISEKQVRKFNDNNEDEVFEEINNNITAEDTDKVVGHLWGDVNPNEWYVLPQNATSVNSENNNFYVKSNGECAFVWLDMIKQFAFKCTDVSAMDIDKEDPEESEPLTKVDIHYHVNQNNNYRFGKLDNLNILHTRKPLLPPELSEVLYSFVKDHPILCKILDNSLSIHERIKIINDYCTDPNFTNEELTETGVIDTIDVLMRIITEHKGACRHRAITFMALTHLIQIPTWIVTNEQHAYVQLPYKTEHGHDWFAIDLGGAPVQDLTNEEEFTRTNSLFEALRSKPKPSEQAKDEVEEIYENEFIELARQSEITDLNQLFAPSPLAPQILVTSAEQAHKVDQLLTEFTTRKMPYLNIHSPKELKQFYDSKKFKDGKLVTNRANGVLKRAISQPGVIANQWMNFDAADIASAKSSLDAKEDRKLIGEPIHPDTFFTGTLTEETPACAAFYSRSKKVTLSPELLASVKPVIESSAESDVVIDLFNSPMWQEILFGDPKIKDSKIYVPVCLLVKAMQAGESVTLFNVPKDPEIEQILHRLTVQKELFYNGEMIKAVPGFSIKVAFRSNPTQTNNLFVSIDAPPMQMEKIIIGTHNFHQLFSKLTVDSITFLANDENGLLNSFDIQSQVFYIVDSLPTNLWQQLVNFIQTNYPNKPFVFNLAPGVSIAEVATSPMGSLTEPMPNIYSCSEPDWLAEKLCKESANPNLAVVIPVNENTSFSDLFYAVDIREQESGELRFELKIHDIARLLSVPNSLVILSGPISRSLANELRTILENGYYYDSSGKRCDIHGKLKLITPAGHPVPFENVTTVNFSYDDCPIAIKEFYRLANMALALQGQKSLELPKSYHLIISMLDRLQHPLLHPHSPIKGLLLYNLGKDSDSYALVNVIGKYMLGPNDDVGVNRIRLSQIIDQLKEGDVLDLDRYFYRILTCFSGSALKHIIGDDITTIFDRDNIPFAVNQRFLASIEKFYLKNTDPRESHNKQLHQLLTLIKQNVSLIIAQGPPGVGKTYNVRKLPDIDPSIEVVEEIEKWLEAPQNGMKKGLLLDEANMAKPGTWDFLKGLCLHNRTVYYKGKLHRLTPDHFIIAAVNPNDFPGRHIHPFFQHHGEVINFKRAGKNFLKKSVIFKLIKQNNVNSYHAIDLLYATYELYMRYQPYRAISIRDLEALTSRYCALISTLSPNENPEDLASIDKALYLACMYEYTFAISDPQKRETFIEELDALFASKMIHETTHESLSLHEYSENYYLPSSKYLLAKIIEQDIQIQELNLNTPTSGNTNFCKRGVLLEGDSGAGKSTMFIKILHKLGYRLNHPDPAKRYYHFSARDPDIEEKLERAFHEGAKVILDELDLNPGLEPSLNAYLTGVDRYGRPPCNSGFFVLASQNGARFTGRLTIPSPLANRFHLMQVDAFSDPELTLMAKRVLLKPECFVRAYRKACCKFSGIVNMRTFYTLLDKYVKQTYDKKTKTRTIDDIDDKEQTEVSFSKRQRLTGERRPQNTKDIFDSQSSLDKHDEQKHDKKTRTRTIDAIEDNEQTEVSSSKRQRLVEDRRQQNTQVVLESQSSAPMRR